MKTFFPLNSNNCRGLLSGWTGWVTGLRLGRTLKAEGTSRGDVLWCPCLPLRGSARQKETSALSVRGEAVTRGRMRLAVAASTVAFAVVAGCSGGSAAGAKGRPAGASDDVLGGTRAAQDEVSKALQNPTGILIDAPLSRRPSSDKLIAILDTPTGTGHLKNLGVVDAARALGWRAQLLTVGRGAEDTATVMDQALDLHPDAVVFGATPVALLGQQLARAQTLKIPVLADSITDPVQNGIISTSLDNPTQVAEYGRLVGSYVAAKSDGKAHAAIFTISAYPVLTVFANSFKQALTAACPTCKVLVVNQQISDLGKNTPQSVVDTLQRDPNINWAIFSLGDLTIGVPEALRAAGLQGKVKIGGETPTQANLQALRAGTEEVWTGFTAAILGWRDVDMLARYFNGESLDAANRTLLPTQLITRENVSIAPLDSTGYYVGFPGYADAFKKLWQLG